MTRGTAWLVHAAVLAGGGTGLVYGWMRYFTESDDPFAITNHPWQPTLQHLHLVLVPLLVFVVGLLWRSHVWGKIRSPHRERRGTGIALALLFWPMVASGYLLQVAVDEAARTFWIWLHGLSSTAWLLCYALHQLMPQSLQNPARPRKTLRD